MDGYFVSLGKMAYHEAWDIQRLVGEAVRTGRLQDTVLFVEHPPVYTVGRGARGSRDNLLWTPEILQREGIDVVEVDRGGDITYHGPGQLVGYPIVDLTRRGRDLHRYLRALEQAIIDTLRDFGIESERQPPHTGVWVGQDKVAAIGVKASRWVTQHGFALNVAPNLDHFLGIVPCGIRDKGVTSMANLLKRPVTLDEVLPALSNHLANSLELTWTAPISVQELLSQGLPLAQP